MLQTFLTALFVASTGASLAMLILGIHARRAPNSFYFCLFVLSIFVLNLGSIFEITAVSRNSAFIAAQVQYVGGPFMAPLFLLFCCEYCGHKVKLRYVAALLIIPAVTIFLMFSWPINHIFYETVIFTAVWPLPHLIPTGSAWYYIYNGYSFLLSIASDVLLIHHYKKRDRIFKRQSVAILIASVLPVANVVFILLLGISSWTLDLTPVFLGVACLCMGYSFLKLGFYRFAPIAREQTVETMKDGYITLDMKGNIVDVNRAAKGILPQLATASPGMKLGDVEGVGWLDGEAETRRDEFEVSQPDGSSRYYKLSENEVLYGGRVIGRCIMIFDATEMRKLFEEVRQLAERDSLTALLNRRTLFTKGELLLIELRETGRTASLIMIDLDHFKKVNDTYGHLKGDEVLRAVAGALMGRLRRTDLVARYGGEEFCALLPEASEESALEIAEDIKGRISELKFDSDQGVFGVTVSIGLAVYDPDRHLTLDSLVSDADTALYAAKNGGRNTIRILVGN